MTEEQPSGDVTNDLDAARRDVIDLRAALEDGAAVETRAVSIDGRTFEFQTPLDEPVPLGGFVVIATQDGHRYLGQVTSREMVKAQGARVTVDVPEIELGRARVSQAELTLETRMAVGHGTLLARITGDDLDRLTLEDVFDRAAMSPADPALVDRFLESERRGAAALDIGWSPFGGPAVRNKLHATGFNRHTFLCGQSGSGKTFSLGVVLERLLLETSLRMIVVDPNSDFVRLGELRDQASYDRTVASPPADDAYHELADGYRRAVERVRVVRAADGDLPLRIRFSDLTPKEQASVLQLDPLRDRKEFAAFQRLSELLAGEPYTLRDLSTAALGTFQEDAREVGLRVANLGVAYWGVWAETDHPAVTDDLAGDWRALVLDVGGLGSAEEQSVIAMGLFNRLWQRRAERRPILVVIDEAHNICPAEPVNEPQALATDHIVRIAAEGRKFGIYLLLSTQRPQKLHPSVLSQCDNLILMRMNSAGDVAHLAEAFSFVPPRIIEESPGFKLGQALVAGKISPIPSITKIEGRLSPEGGGDVATTWATGG